MPIPGDAPRPPAVNVEERPNGELILTCPIPPATVDAEHMVELLSRRAAEHPERSLIVEKDEEGVWQHLTYGEAVRESRKVAQWLLDHGASVERPLAILSPRSRQHFLMAWGAQMAGVPSCAVSLPYSTVPGAFPKLRWVLERVHPGFIYAEDPTRHAAALDSIDPDSTLGGILSEATFITGEGGHGTTPFNQLEQTEDSSSVDDAIAAITPETITRYLFTSGSTGMPKGVIQTHAMHLGFIAAMSAIDNSDPDTIMRVLDWMPWSHTAAGVMRLNLVINRGGAVYLDDGRPVPGHFGKTVANLADVRPTTYSGSPLGWTMLVDALESDDELAATFFANATSFGFGAAAMPESLAERVQALARRHTGDSILLTTSLLSTEVSVCLNRWWPTLDHHVLGLPGPGADIKLVPAGDDRFEIRPRGRGVTPGYLGDPAATAAAFDEEGFFKMGDAVRMADTADIQRGLCFAGRVAEDFKLSSGTWVEAGTLRSLVVAAGSPYIQDAVICGLNESDVTALIWPSVSGCRAIAGDGDPVRSSAVRNAIAAGLGQHNEANPASSTRISRFLLLDEPPDRGANEITEKGYINQRAVQDHRVVEVARLYDPADSDVVTVPDVVTVHDDVTVPSD